MDRTIIFIIGAGHSGSTLLAKALNAHSKIFSLSEISQFYEDIHQETAQCGCGTLLKDCEFWEDINKSLQEKKGFGIKERPDLFRIGRKENKNSLMDKIVFRISRILAVNLNLRTRLITNRLFLIKVLYDEIYNKTGANTLVDSSKSAKRAYLLRNYLSKKGYDIKIVHLVRDGRAVLHSYLKGYYKVKIKDPGTGKYEMKTFYSDRVYTVEETVKRWKRDNLESIFYHKKFNKKGYYFLRYEDYTTWPEKELTSLLDFVNHTYEPEMLDLNRYENHMVSGNASRINADRILLPEESWKTNLSEDKINYFRKKAGKLNHRFGY